MKRNVRERLPKRLAGSFPSFLYKCLDELEDADAWSTSNDAWHRKPLLILSDMELDEAVLMRIGFP